MIHTLIKEFIPAIKALAQESPKVERCGIICDRHLLTFDNVHDDPANHFMLRARDVLNMRSSDFIVWHTHTPKGFHELTDADVGTAKFIKRPILMVRGDGATDYYDPTTPLPYVGRTWRTFHRNCYSLMQDWYKGARGVALPDFFLNQPEEFDGRSPSQFLTYLPEFNFQQQPLGHGHIGSTLQIGDVILTTEKRGAEGWHCSVVTDVLPYVKCLSQWIDRPSGYFPFRAIANRVHSVWRYGR